MAEKVDKKIRISVEKSVDNVKKKMVENCGKNSRKMREKLGLNSDRKNCLKKVVQKMDTRRGPRKTDGKIGRIKENEK